MTKVLVYGWYHHGNIGDDLFTEAFSRLFINYQFVFTDSISLDKLTDIDAVFFGGGSFLSERPIIDSDAMDSLMLSKKIFYLGVGVESNIHHEHLQLMSRARMIATRSPEQADKLRLICPNVKVIPDLVYSLQNQIVQSNKEPRSVLVMPNISIVPNRSGPHWKFASWNYFKSEFSQFLDWLVENDYQITRLPSSPCVKESPRTMIGPRPRSFLIWKRENPNICNMKSWQE